MDIATSRGMRAGLLATALLLAARASPAVAGEPAYVVLSAGATGIWHHNSHVQHTVAIGSAEYRTRSDLWRGVKPLLGALATSDGSAYAHAGFYRDFEIGALWILTPHGSAGVYSHGDKNDLGSTGELQTGVDLQRRLDNGWRVGVTLRHLSNGGSGHYNAGIATLALLVAVPLR